MVIPTYDELGNLQIVVTKLVAVATETDMLVVDDGRPDGTGELADKMALNDEHIHAMHPTGKLGLGSACVQGFRWRLERGTRSSSRWTSTAHTRPRRCPPLRRRSSPSVRGATALAIGSR